MVLADGGANEREPIQALQQLKIDLQKSIAEALLFTGWLFFAFPEALLQLQKLVEAKAACPGEVVAELIVIHESLECAFAEAPLPQGPVKVTLPRKKDESQESTT